MSTNILATEVDSFSQLTKKTDPVFKTATVRDRFAARSIDLPFSMLVVYATLRAIAIYRPEIWVSPVAIGCLAAGSFFMYCFLSEGAFGQTIGKRACHIAVRGAQGERSGVVAALVRTVLLPADLLIGAVLICTSDTRQRLGDRIAATIVITQTNNGDVSQLLGSRGAWEQRARAAIVDLVLISLFSASYFYAAGWFDPSVSVALHSPLKQCLSVLGCILVYFTVFEGFFGATTGALLSDLRVVPSGQRSSQFGIATLRALAYPFNLVTLGILPFLMMRYTQTGQHFGDRIAAARVVNEPRRHRRRVLMLAITFAIPIGFIILKIVSQHHSWFKR